MPEKAKEALFEMEHKNQLIFEFPSQADLTGLRTMGEYHQGAELVLGALVDRIGISPNYSLLRQLVIARILFPVSKIRTVSFLNKSFGTHLKTTRSFDAEFVLLGVLPFSHSPGSDLFLGYVKSLENKLYDPIYDVIDLLAMLTRLFVQLFLVLGHSLFQVDDPSHQIVY